MVSRAVVNLGIERLRRRPNGRLAVDLSLARTALRFSQTAEQREAAMREIEAIKRELMRRQVPDEAA